METGDQGDLSISKVDLVYLGWTTITWIKDRPVLQVPTGLMLPRPSLINLVRGTTVYRERSSKPV